MNQELLALQNAVWDVIVVVGVIGGLIVALVLACLFCRKEETPRGCSHQGLPDGVYVGRFDGGGGNWHWSVHDPLNGRLIETGTEPTELAAVNMAWAAYDRATEADTAIVERRAAE